MEGDPSIVEYFAEHEGYRCGYCKSKDTNFSHGMWAHQMHVQDYQDLIDRGWRRSGKYCYKPTMNRTCCPMYTIKCDALEFKLSKSQKKAIKKVNRFLITGKRDSGSDGTGSQKDEDEGMSGEGDVKNIESMLADKVKPSPIELPFKAEETTNNKSNNKNVNEADTPTPSTVESPRAGDGTASSTWQPIKKKHPPKPGTGADPNKPTCRKAKELRAERRQQKLAANSDKGNLLMQRPKNGPKGLEELLNEPDQAPHCAHKLELRLVRSSPGSSMFSSTFNATHRVYHNYQMGIHKDPPSKPTQRQFTRFLCDSPLGLRLCRSSPRSDPFKSSFKMSHSVYHSYQMVIHNDLPDECNEVNFENFLVDSPLKELHKTGGPSMGYGSFHQQYVLDGEIIAVGVVDILPSCISSVYLYYDPAYRFLTLGVYSALREIAFVRELAQQTPDLHYYYMGFYIQSCPKMRYKGHYTPSFLSCPETYNWIPLEQCAPKLDVSAYARFEKEGVEDKDKVTDISQVLTLHQRTTMPYSIYAAIKKNKNTDETEVTEYANFVGKSCAERMLLFRK